MLIMHNKNTELFIIPFKYYSHESRVRKGETVDKSTASHQAAI